MKSSATVYCCSTVEVFLIFRCSLETVLCILKSAKLGCKCRISKMMNIGWSQILHWKKKTSGEKKLEIGFTYLYRVMSRHLTPKMIETVIFKCPSTSTPGCGLPKWICGYRTDVCVAPWSSATCLRRCWYELPSADPQNFRNGSQWSGGSFRARIWCYYRQPTFPKI